MAEDPVLAFFDLSREPPKVFASTGQLAGKVVVPEDKQFPMPGAFRRKLLGNEYSLEAMRLEDQESSETFQNERSKARSFVVNRNCMTGVDDLTSVASTSAPRHPDLETADLVYDKFDFNKFMVPQTLPITPSQVKVVTMIKSYQTTIIKGATGCGKSTQVPQFILDYCCKDRAPCNIVVTQPRRIAARSVAERVCKERGWELGSVVGYQVGLDSTHVTPDTRVTFCTTGVLLQILVKERSLDRYTHIILDEVHERSQEMDFVLALIKKFLRASPGVKVILMSATYNVERFATYFGTYLDNGKRHTTENLIPASIIDLDNAEKSLTGYTASYYYMDELCQISADVSFQDLSTSEPCIIPGAYEVAVKLIKRFIELERNSVPRCTTPGSVLVFLPGINEIERLYKLLSQEPETNWLVKPLHSLLTNEEQRDVFLRPPPGERKIILSTNIAESSITVPDIAFVIDFVLTKHLICDVETNFSSLQLTWASKSSCIQRAGRTGRTCNGRVFRLVPKKFYDGLHNEDLPEMLRGPLERVVILTKLLNMGEPKHIIGLTLDAPDEAHLNKAILLLKEKGALLPTVNGQFTTTDGDLTFLGHMMGQLPVDPVIAKLIMLGHIFSCLKECIIMGAAMTMKSLFSSPFQKQLQAYHNRLSWADSSCSDPISLLNAYNTWRVLTGMGFFNRSAGGGEEEWASRNFIQIRVMHEVHLLVVDLTARLSKLGIHEPTGQSRINWDKYQFPLILKVVLAGAFYPNYCCRGEQGGQINEQEAVKLLNGLNPFTSVYLQGMPSDQPKELYAQRIKAPLKDCSHQMVVSFDNSNKAYVEFADMLLPGVSGGDDKQYTSDIPGKIVMGVYRAIKVRQASQTPIIIPMLRPADAWMRAKKLGLRDGNNESWVFERRPIEGCRAEAWKSMQTNLSHHIAILISYVEDAGHFWAQKKDPDGSVMNSEWMYNTLQTPEYLVPLTHKPVIGHLYAVLFKEANDKVGKYYRAKVVRDNASKRELAYEVHFIDFGNSQKSPVNDFRDFHPSMKDQILDIPAMAFECVLAEVQPSIVMNQTGLWTEQANNAFKSMTTNAQLFAEVYSMCHGVVSLILQAVKTHDSVPMPEVSVNKNLILMGFGQPAEESYLSQRNNEMRKANRLRNEDKCEENDEELPEEPRFYTQIDVSPPPIADCPLHVPLRGPISPLEMKVYAMTQSGIRHKVNIDKSSVNSVLLDTDPQDPHERLMVSACIALNATGSAISLRHSTMMPNIHGLPALICLMFAPQVEFRVNRVNTIYTGAVCGLGVNAATNKAVFPENDMEVTFDTVISPNDVSNINTIRFWMNQCFVTDADDDGIVNADSLMVHEARFRIKDHIDVLLRCQRKTLDIVVTSQPFKWNLIGKDMLIRPTNNLNCLAENVKRGVYILHWGVILNITPQERKKIESMLDNADELRQLADGRYELKRWATCDMCQFTMGSRSHLKTHLSSRGHVTVENSYRERIGMQSLEVAGLAPSTYS